MDGLGKPEINADDEPLFILTYRQRAVSSTTVLLSLFILFFGLLIFVPASQKQELVMIVLSKLAFGSVVLLCIRQLIDLWLFRELRLYQDRIVRVSKMTRAREIKLDDAKVLRRRGGGILIEGDAGWFRPVVRGTFFVRALADPAEELKMYTLLAELSGRKVYELTDPPISGERLIKKGSAPRVITRERLETLLRETEYESPRNKEFNRVATIGLLVVILGLALGSVILLYSVWRSVR